MKIARTETTLENCQDVILVVISVCAIHCRLKRKRSRDHGLLGSQLHPLIAMMFPW